MGRKKKDESTKKQTISISLDKTILDELFEIKVKRSELINSLLKKHFNLESDE